MTEKNTTSVKPDDERTRNRGRDSLGLGGSNIDNVAWHDFSEYQWVRDPDYVTAPLPGKPTGLVICRPGSYNLGVRIVYRQEWRPLGNQRGDVIRTIPLGPKQMEKVSTAIKRRTKITQTSESLRSVETTTETTDTTKDSSEIVKEASESFGWNVEAEASMNVGWAKASVSGGARGESEQKSKETSSQLSESMKKTASKIRTETKLIVSTESESAYEMTTASEIQNPNEEIPITYVYSKLQRQYEILTSLAEVQNVIMVAEEVPELAEDDTIYAWLKQHDWKIAKVLLDDSFRDALNSISQEVDIDPTLIADYSGSALKTVLDSTMSSITSLSGNLDSLSLSEVDVIHEAQKGYTNFAKEQKEEIRQQLLLLENRKRLYDHIRENILHYCRAVWSHEDSQQRLLRYRNIEVPIKWHFIEYGENGQASTNVSLNKILNRIIIRETAQTTAFYDNFEKAIETSIFEENSWQNWAALIAPNISTRLISILQDTPDVLQTIIDIYQLHPYIIGWILSNIVPLDTNAAEWFFGISTYRNDPKYISDTDIQNTWMNIKSFSEQRDWDNLTIQEFVSNLGNEVKNEIYQWAESTYERIQLPYSVSEKIKDILNRMENETESLTKLYVIYPEESIDWMLEKLATTDVRMDFYRDIHNGIITDAEMESKITEIVSRIDAEWDLQVVPDFLEKLREKIETTISMEVDWNEWSLTIVPRIIERLVTNLDNDLDTLDAAQKVFWALLLRNRDSMSFLTWMFYEFCAVNLNLAEWLVKLIIIEGNEGFIEEIELQQRWRNVGRAINQMWANVDEVSISELDGEFDFRDSEDIVRLSDLINPAGPIGYYSNYAIFYLKPEFTSSDIALILHILKTPYLYFDPEHPETPMLMDALLKKYTKEFEIMKEEIEDFSISEDIKDEMVEIVPELRLRYFIALNKENFEDAISQLFQDEELFNSYYPEYLFRLDQVRKFVVDTNNLIVDIEPGTGTALEGFKLAHRELDVMKAFEEKEQLRLTNRRLKELLKEKKLDIKHWPETEKIVVIDGNSSTKPVVSGLISRKNKKKPKSNERDSRWYDFLKKKDEEDEEKKNKENEKKEIDT